ncbi:LacI family DNA-binding transcriptional regulator [Nesterenkonia sp. CL21]|uniref:LacI family DNA-binding transcriptional regulator n=1 Tax=Nesterenkonia sp. CL21 TaxID=3064894 RepID=UPI0028787A4A|nr:LacI family DNA-binding transcriptional regulator [Nesterenkonia sp. CL21]MDS2173395.1 LacI family DNA-binding transcriptional regulator [Nesterenkonia sp. CL21]
MGRRVTLQDVATAAGVSLKTASRVVNGERYVAEATALKVRAAVRELGFRPHQAARSLARGRRLPMAGLLVTTLENPHVVALAHGVEQVLRAAGHSLIIASTDEDAEQERQLLENFQDRGVDSVVIVPSGDDHRHLVAASGRLSMVLAHRVIEGLEADSVAPDDWGATRTAVKALLHQGHARVAFIGDLEYIYNIRRRVAGYRQAHRELGVPVDELLLRFGVRTAAESRRAMAEMLDSPAPPTAVFASNNLLTLGVLEELHGQGETLAVVGFDDLPEARYFDLPVTLLAYDKAGVGRTAARLLLERAAAEDPAPRHVTMPVEARQVEF